MAYLNQTSQQVTDELDWHANYCRKRQVEQIRFEVLNESLLRPRPLVASALNRLDFWYSEEACVGFDVLAFLTSGTVLGFNSSLETVTEALAASGVDVGVPSRLSVCAVRESVEPVEVCQVGPVQDERIVKALLLGWRAEMLKHADESDWVKALICLFDISRGANPERELDKLRDITSRFGRYDGEFCAHSCGELFARPFLDCAAILAHAGVEFETLAPGVFQATQVPVLGEPYFEEFVVPGLGLLLLEQLQVEPGPTRFESIKYSGDRRWLAQFDAETLPLGLFGHMGRWSRGARFLFYAERDIQGELESFDKVQYVLVVERDLRMTLLKRPGAAFAAEDEG